MNKEEIKAIKEVAAIIAKGNFDRFGVLQFHFDDFNKYTWGNIFTNRIACSEYYYNDRAMQQLIIDAAKMISKIKLTEYITDCQAQVKALKPADAYKWYNSKRSSKSRLIDYMLECNGSGYDIYQATYTRALKDTLIWVFFELTKAASLVKYERDVHAKLAARHAEFYATV